MAACAPFTRKRPIHTLDAHKAIEPASSQHHFFLSALFFHNVGPRALRRSKNKTFYFSFFFFNTTMMSPTLVRCPTARVRYTPQALVVPCPIHAEKNETVAMLSSHHPLADIATFFLSTKRRSTAEYLNETRAHCVVMWVHIRAQLVEERPVDCSKACATCSGMPCDNHSCCSCS